MPEGLRVLFSTRAAQVEAYLAKVLRRWVDAHDGEEPDARTIARLERRAVLKSRPAKHAVGDADSLRAGWCDQARRAGFELPVVPDRHHQLPGHTALDREAVMAEALSRVMAEGSTWLAADLAREIATLVPPGAGSARAVVALVDELAAEAAGRCVELHPPALPGTVCRSDGRPVTEAVTDRLLSAPAVLAQERRLLDWAAEALRHGEPRPVEAPGLEDEQVAAASAVAGTAPLVLVVGPAGSGKTRTLAAAVRSLQREGRVVTGLAPSGKAADVLAAEAGCRTLTLAKLLHELVDRRRSPVGLPAGSTVLLDEASMASTEDLDRLVGLARRNRWRLVLVGDPDQLPAVGRGGMFASWCDTLPAFRLEQVRRFVEPWQAEASRGLRAGDPEAVAAYAAHGRLNATHPALVAERVARQHEVLAADGATVAITTSSIATARDINRAIQYRSRSWHTGPGVRLADGTKVYAGDRIATRCNDASLVTDGGAAVRNRQGWTVVTVGSEGSLVVEEPGRGRVVLHPSYVARHVELGWAVTGYGSQGVTVDHGICVVEPGASRAGVYVGMTRGRHRNLALVVDRSGLVDTAEALVAILQRPASGVTAHAARARLYAEHGQALPVEEPPQQPWEVPDHRPRPPQRSSPGLGL